MNNDRYTTPQIVLPNGPFIPLVMADIGLPTAFVAAAARSLSKKFDDSRNTFSSSIQALKHSLSPISMSQSSASVMLSSIEDINI